MSLKSILLLTSVLSTSATFANSWKNFNLVNGCYIMDAKGDSVKSFPGNFCQFMPDGSYLSATDVNLKYQSKNNELIWELPAHYHHQLNLTHDQKRILVLSTAIAQVKGKSIRQDLFRVLSMDGKVLHEAPAQDYLKQIKQENHQFTPTELTHFNSFYEIPPMNEGLKLPDYIRPGNFILNAYRLGILIVSADLKTVLHYRSLTNSKNNQTHDAQILPNGKLIYFNNEAQDGGQNILHSSIDEIDLNQDKQTIIFTAEPKEMFFSRHCGGVQYLDQDHVLFSHMLAGTYIYSMKDKKIISNLYRTHLNQQRFYPAQQVKALDLKKFLSHWK